MADALTKKLNGYSFENIYLDLELASWNGQAQKGSEFAQEILKRFPYLNIQNAYPILRDLRTIKEPGEVQRIKKAIEITHLGIQRLMEVLKPGMKEYQAEAYFDFEIKHAGARDHAFETIAASGVNATILHYVGKQDTIGEDVVLTWVPTISIIVRTYPDPTSQRQITPRRGPVRYCSEGRVPGR